MADMNTEDQMQQTEDEEFEFRARAEQEARARQEVSPASEGGAVNPAAIDWTKPSDIGRAAVGAAKTAYDVGAPVIAEHPIASTYLASHVPGLNKLPVLSDIKDTRELAKQVLKRGAGVTPAVNPAGAQMTGVGSPSQPLGGGPAGAAPQAAAEGEGIMSKLSGLYKQYGPAIGEHFTQAGKAIADSRVGQMAGAVAESPAGQMAGKVLGGAARIAGSAPAIGAQLMLHSGGLNEGEDAQLKAIQNSPEYKMQMKQYLELKKKQQDEQNHLKQMSQNVNPNLPNAFTSGYAQQLNNGTA